jgi:YHYH protein
MIVTTSPRRAARPLSLLLLAVTPAVAAAQSIPVGDGHVTDHPVAGNAGAWIHGDMWNPLEKPHVSGRVFWPDADFVLTAQDSALRVQSNGLPVDEPTGIFPINPSDSAYRYDTNPNHVGRQHLDFVIPAHPEPAAAPECLPMGMIGVTVSGVALYNALDDAGRDAAAHEVQDNCDGHPQANAQYHYHNASPCIPGVNSDRVVGWALDGYPILGMEDAAGHRVTNADLDACHGRAEQVTVNGRTYDYAYHLTREYPYTLGCFAGRVSESTLTEVHSGLEPSRRGGRGRGRGVRPGRGGGAPEGGG